MGYTTNFDGTVRVSPPLNAAEVDYLKRFNCSRRMKRGNGPYFAEPGDDFGQQQLPDIINYNSPDESQPGLWCGWEPTDDGTAIQWDGGEKFYDSVEWMQYLIDHFLSATGKARGAEGFEQFTFDHVLDGVIHAQGEEVGDAWQLVVEGNVVNTGPLGKEYVRVENPYAY